MAAITECFPKCLVGRRLDKNSHGGGFIIGGKQEKVYNYGRLISIAGEPATPDGKCDDDKHCNPKTKELAPGKVYINGSRIHRLGDKRRCGALTEPLGPTRKVWITGVDHAQSP